MIKIFSKINESWRLSALGSTVSSRIKIFLYYFISLFHQRYGTSQTINVWLDLSYLGNRFSTHISGADSFFLLRDIFLYEEYDFPGIVDPRIIIDLGSNVGFSAIYFKSKYPNADIYAFEANPLIFDQLKSNTESFRDIHCYNMAVSNADGNVPFFISKLSVSSSLLKRKNTQEINVPCLTLHSIFTMIGCEHVDLLKFDIEGYEYEIFKSTSKNILEKIVHIIGEIHCDLMGQDVKSFIHMFDFGFRHDVRKLSTFRSEIRLTRIEK